MRAWAGAIELMPATGAPASNPAAGVPPSLRLLGWACVAAAAVLALQLVGAAALGPGGTRLLTAPAPRRWALLAFFALAAGLFLVGGAWRGRRAFVEFAGRVVLLGSALAFSFLAAEAGLRVFLWRTQSRQSLDRLDDASRTIKSTHPLAFIVRRSANPALIFELKPNLDVDFGPVRVRTNALGMRTDREYPEARSPRSFRIVGIGDSGMFGWDVAQGDPYPAALEANLNRRGDGVAYEVLNFGVPGYNTALEVESLRSRGLAFRPDVVVVGWCENDVQTPLFVPQVGQWTRRDVSLLWLLLFDRGRYADVALSRIATRKRDSDPERIPAEVLAGQDVGGVRAAFAELKRLGAERRFRTLVFGPMQPEIEAVCEASGLACFNTKMRIPLGKYPKGWLVYFMHPTREGHAALAQEIEAELDRLGWLAPGGGS